MIPYVMHQLAIYVKLLRIFWANLMRSSWFGSSSLYMFRSSIPIVLKKNLTMNVTPFTRLYTTKTRAHFQFGEGIFIQQDSKFLNLFFDPILMETSVLMFQKNCFIRSQVWCMAPNESALRVTEHGACSGVTNFEIQPLGDHPMYFDVERLP